MRCGGTENDFAVGSIRAVVRVDVVVEARGNLAGLAAFEVDFVEPPANLVVDCRGEDFLSVVGNVDVGNRALGLENLAGFLGIGDVVDNPKLVGKSVALRPALQIARIDERGVALPVLGNTHSRRAPLAEDKRPLGVFFQKRIRQKRLFSELLELRGARLCGRVARHQCRFDFGHRLFPFCELCEVAVVLGIGLFDVLHRGAYICDIVAQRLFGFERFEHIFPKGNARRIARFRAVGGELFKFALELARRVQRTLEGFG